MSSSCIHVTALLFRVEAANRNGLTNPACTSRECSWNVPQQSSKVKPTRICDINWTASKLNKGEDEIFGSINSMNSHVFEGSLIYIFFISFSVFSM